MALEFTPWALPGLLSGLLSWGMAWVVYSTRPQRLQNRLLALFLALAGSAWFLVSGVAQLTGDGAVAYAAFVTGFTVHVLSHAVHLLFLSTLPTRLVAPLRRPLVRVAILGAFLGWAAHLVLFPSAWVSFTLPTAQVGAWAFAPGELYARYWGLFDVLWWLGFAVSIAAYRNQAAWRDRRQAKAYLAAFTVHDGGFGLLLGMFLFAPPTDPFLTELLFVTSWPLMNIWLAVLLAYAILRQQLFDIDLRVKATVRHSTVAAAFVGVFFVVSEGAQGLFQSSLGPVVGLVAAGALVFVLAPLQRAAERLSERAVPGASGSDEYLAFRKLEVYRAALDEALADGQLTDKDRRVLAALRSRLGIQEGAASALERDALAALAARGPGSRSPA